MDNEQIARRFNRMAALMEVRGEDPFRLRSYRMAAEAIETWPVAMQQIVAGDPPEGDPATCFYQLVGGTLRMTSKVLLEDTHQSIALLASKVLHLLAKHF